MLKNYVLNEKTCKRYYQSMAGPHLDFYLKWLNGQGYQYQSIRRYIRGAVQFAQWGEDLDLDITQLGDKLLGKFSEFLDEQGCLKTASGSYRQSYQASRLFEKFLSETGVLLIQNEVKEAVYPILYTEFRSWMLTHKGVTVSTLDGYRAIVLDLLDRLGERPGKYTAKDLRKFVLHRVHNHNKSSAQNVISATRMFLRFLVTSGHIDSGLVESIPNIAAWRLQSVPRSLPSDVIRTVIASCDTSTTLGARNRAVFILLAQLGLRAGEVAALRLDDIDWQSATINIRDKCRREEKLPLPQAVGDALLHYLECYRPDVAIEQVFVSTLAPHRALRRVSVSQLATRGLRRAGVSAPKLGAHMFRHSIATTLLAEGVSLQSIAAVLRHSSLESTRLYASVDQSLLRVVAREWPAVTSC